MERFTQSQHLVRGQLLQNEHDLTVPDLFALASLPSDSSMLFHVSLSLPDPISPPFSANSVCDNITCSATELQQQLLPSSVPSHAAVHALRVPPTITMPGTSWQALAWNMQYGQQFQQQAPLSNCVDFGDVTYSLATIDGVIDGVFEFSEMGSTSYPWAQLLQQPEISARKHQHTAQELLQHIEKVRDLRRKSAREYRRKTKWREQQAEARFQNVTATWKRQQKEVASLKQEVARLKKELAAKYGVIYGLPSPMSETSFSSETRNQ
jgi:hypothetical protein